MSLTQLYVLFILLPGLGKALCAIGAISLSIYGIAFLATGMIGLCESKWEPIKSLLKYKALPIIAVIFVMIGSMLPSQKDMIILTGAYGVTNNKEMIKLPDNVLKALNYYLEQIPMNKEEKKQFYHPIPTHSQFEEIKNGGN